MGRILGIVAGIASIVLWIVLVFANPYAVLGSGGTITTFVMLFLPACLAIFASIKGKHVLLLLAFIWSLPISLYVYFTPGIFSWFGITSFTYLFSFVLTITSMKISEMKKVRENYKLNSNTDHQ
nr:hypothetical protein [Lysinibacillus timonensis]